jgi:amino acid transporter
MSGTHKISLSSAVLINLNVMIGSGIFINTVILSKNAGGLGALAYLTVGVLILPLILSISRLSQLHGGGSFFDYGSNLGAYAGFVTSTSYFFAKLASCALGIHVSISLLQTLFEPLARIPTLWIDLLVILFMFLNTRNLRVGKQIQVWFVICKFVPILFVVFTGLYLFNPGNFAAAHLYPAGIMTSVPFILHAFMGFEISCSLSRSLENPEKNGPRAVLYAYGLGVALVCIFQFLFYGALGTMFEGLGSYLDAYPALIGLLPGLSLPTAELFKGILHIGIALSALGAAYGIMYSNAWNLFELAARKQIFKPAFFARLNVHHIPLICVFVEAFVAALYLIVTGGYQVPLQQVAAYGSTIAYSLSALGLVAVIYRVEKRIAFWPLLGVGSCCLLIGFMMRNFYLYGFLPPIVFTIVLIGTSLAMRRTNQDKIDDIAS